MADLSYTTDIAKLKDPVTVLFSKGLPSRGHTRTTHARAEKLLFPSQRHVIKYEELRRIKFLTFTRTAQAISAMRNDTVGVEYARSHSRSKKDKNTLARDRFMRAHELVNRRRMDFKKIMVASILGNYPHVESHRMHGPAREWIRKRFLDDDWFVAILHGCPLLFLWCVRDFMVDHMLDSPGLRAATAEFVRFKHFKRITADAMKVARAYVQQNACHAWSVLGGYHPPPVFSCRCLLDKKNQRKGTAKKAKATCLYSDVEWLSDLQLLLKPFHEELLLVAFKKPDMSVVSFLTSEEVRLKLPLVPRRLSPSEQEETDKDMRIARQHQLEEREYDDMMTTVKNIMKDVDRRENRTYKYGNEQSNRLREFVSYFATPAKDEMESKFTASETDRLVSAHVYQFIAPHQFAVLAKLVKQLGNNVPGIMKALPMFGVDDPKVSDFVQQLLVHCQYGTITKHERVRHLQLIRKLEAHTYNIMQVAAELIQFGNRNQAHLVGRLSAEELGHQIEAAHRRSLDIITVDDMRHLNVTKRLIVRATAKAAKDPAQWQPLVNELTNMKNQREQRIRSIQEAYHRNPGIEESCVMLQYCKVCSAVYSNYRSLKRTKKRSARWGLQDAWRLSSSPEPIVHCGNHMVNHIGECSKMPLAKINLLGVRVVLNRTAFQLCVRCADVMVPSSRHCVEVKEGTLCVECSRLHLENELTANDPSRQWAAKLNRTCVGCNRVVCSDQNTVLLPFSLVLCKQCTRTRGLLSRVFRDYAQFTCRQDAKEQIEDMFRACSENRRAIRVARDKPVMLHNKRKSRMKRR
jgi:hypothetical protein